MEKGTLVKTAIARNIERIGIVVSAPYVNYDAPEELRGERYKVLWQDHPVFKVICTVPCIESVAAVDLKIISLPVEYGKR